MVFAFKVFGTFIDMLLLTVLSAATFPIGEKQKSHRVSYYTFVFALVVSILGIWLRG